MARPNLTLTCEHCGIAFVQSQNKHHPQLFCSCKCSSRSRKPKSDAERFWRCVDKHGQIPTHRPDLGPCWIWCQHLNGPYGQFSIRRPSGKGTIAAHRWSYISTFGPILDSLVIDHLCRNPPCVNPTHLEPVTQAVNVARGLKGRPTHCKRGHPFDDINTYYRQGNPRMRTCRSCHSMHGQRYYRQKLEARHSNVTTTG